MLPAPQALRLYVRANLAMVPIWTAMPTASPANPMLGNAESDVGLQLVVGPICRAGFDESITTRQS
jgi:hypothetical protein